MPADFLYRAFLSYSHSDRLLATWLHRSLETYRIPPKLIGTPTPFGRVPARLTPVFKDREELSAAGSLGEVIEAALARSSALVVICSPAAAASHWVNEEVRAFKRVNGGSRVYAVIASGEPWASRVPGREAEECFPPALRFAVDADGKLTDTPAEPIAADLRAEGDGRKLGKLKLIAGLIGVRLDDLVQRESQRRQRRLGYVAAASIAGMTVSSGLAVAAVQARDEAQDQRNEAQHQRAEADGLVEFMLSDLRKKLEPVGRLDVLDSVGRRALTYYGGQDPGTLDPDALGRRARALHLVAEVRNLRGDSEGALKAFRQAAATTGELLARDPNDGQRIFDHAQSVFWVGYIAWQRGDIATARNYFAQYLQNARLLTKVSKASEAWQGELGHANINLGVLELDENRPRQAYQYFDDARRVWVELRQQATEKREFTYLLARTLAWQADASRKMLDYRSARAHRQQEQEIYRSLLGNAPDDSQARESLAVALLRSAQIDLEIGETQNAVNHADLSLRGITKLSQSDPSNKLWQEIAVKAGNMRAEALMMSGDWRAARRENVLTLDRARKLVATDRTIAEWRSDCLLPARWMEIAIEFVDGDRASARELMDRFGQDFSWNEGTKSADERFAWIMVTLLDGNALRRAGKEAEARASFERAALYLPKSGSPMDARLLGAAEYLQRSTRVSGLPAPAPAAAVRVRYDVGALLPENRG